MIARKDFCRRCYQLKKAILAAVTGLPDPYGTLEAENAPNRRNTDVIV